MEFIERRVTGYKKQQAGQGCEDAVYVKECDNAVIMACADGHGDRKCKYAARGAEIATRVIVSELEKVQKSSDDVDDFGEKLNDTRRALKENIVCNWVCAVLDDYKINHPEDTVFSEKYTTLREYSNKIYEARSGTLTVNEIRELYAYRHECEDAIYKITILYGTTVNAVVYTNKFVFAIGIGDGDVIAVNGKRVEWLLPGSERYSTTTASLCGNFSSVIDCFAAVFVPITATRKISDNKFLPEFVMIATDGLRNAFLSDEEFAEKMMEISSLLKKGGGYSFVKHSKAWIEERTRFGVTQDDISFCMCTKHTLKKKNIRKSKKG